MDLIFLVSFGSLSILLGMFTFFMFCTDSLQRELAKPSPSIQPALELISTGIITELLHAAQKPTRGSDFKPLPSTPKSELLLADSALLALSLLVKTWQLWSFVSRIKRISTIIIQQNISIGNTPCVICTSFIIDF